MASTEPTPNTGRKLFFGLFIFPLVIAVGMAILLCSVILLTHEEETPESLITAIKTGSPSKRWQKAYELSNELNRNKGGIRHEGVVKEIIHILHDSAHYDSKTRGYMAIALSHFNQPEAITALRKALNDNDKDVQFYALWSLGVLQARAAATDCLPFLKNESDELRKMAAYVLGVMENQSFIVNLKPLLNDPAADVKWNAALSLARLGDDSGLEVLLKMLEREELAGRYKMSDEAIERVMINATKGLALIRKPESIKILESVSQNDKSLKVRQAAINALRYDKSKGSDNLIMESL